MRHSQVVGYGCVCRHLVFSVRDWVPSLRAVQAVVISKKLGRPPEGARRSTLSACRLQVVCAGTFVGRYEFPLVKLSIHMRMYVCEVNNTYRYISVVALDVMLLTQSCHRYRDDTETTAVGHRIFLELEVDDGYRYRMFDFNHLPLRPLELPSF